MSHVSGTLQRVRELVEFDLVRVALGRVDARVAEQPFERRDVTAALAHEAIGESVPQLVRGELAHAGALTDTPNHSPQSLIARGQLRVFPLTHALELRHPLLNLDGEYVVVELGLQPAEALTQRGHDVGIERKPLPVRALAERSDTAANKIEVSPPARENFRPTEARALHEKQRRELVGESSGANAVELVEARPVDVRLALRRSSDLSRGIGVDQILALGPREE